MRLDELIGYRSSDEYRQFRAARGDASGLSHPVSFTRFLKDKGFVQIGMGVYGVTFAHSQLDYVVKIFGRDEGYQSFLNYAFANRSNKHLPQIRGRFIPIDQDYTAVRMERLSRLPANLSYICEIAQEASRCSSLENLFDRYQRDDEYAQSGQPALDQVEVDIADMTASLLSMIERHGGVQALPMLPLRHPPDIRALRRTIHIKQQQLEQMKQAQNPERIKRVQYALQNRDFCTTAHAIGRFADQNVSLDLHEGNIMMRGDVAVFTDPLA